MGGYREVNVSRLNPQYIRTSWQLQCLSKQRAIQHHSILVECYCCNINHASCKLEDGVSEEKICRDINYILALYVQNGVTYA